MFPIDYFFMFFYAVLTTIVAFVFYYVGLKRWVERLRHPRLRRMAMLLWGIGLFIFLESTYWWNELKKIWEWPYNDIVPLAFILFSFVWAVILILFYQRALRPVNVNY